MRYESDVISKNIKRNQKIKKYLIIILYLMLIPVILFSLLLILLELGNSHELPSSFDIEMYSVVSESMEPKLKINDIVLVKKNYDLNKFKVGNIITFKRSDGEIITHRIVRIVHDNMNNAFITQGDNNDVEDDEVVKFDMIIGKVVYVMPRIGWAMTLLKNKVFFSLLILSFILMIAYDNNQRKKMEERRIAREKHEKKSDFYF